MGPVGAYELLEGSAWPQTGSGSSGRTPDPHPQELPGAGASVTESGEGREADWDLATHIQILPETQKPPPIVCIVKPGRRASLLYDLMYISAPL